MKSRFFSKRELFLLIFIPIFVCVLCIFFGRVNFCFRDFYNFFYDLFFDSSFGIDNLSNNRFGLVFFKIRLPRILLAFIAGSGLSLASLVFQSMFCNPLATPDTIGTASGASFGAVFAILLGLPLSLINVFSFVFAIIAVMLTYFCSFYTNNTFNNRLNKNNLKFKFNFFYDVNGITVILCGIMVSSFFSALISLVKYLSDTETVLPNITFWLMGSFSSASFKDFVFGFPLIIIASVVLFLYRWKLNYLLLSKDEAISLGVNINLLRIVSLICSCVITASCVSMCGQVGWVGLIIPNLCRMKYGNNHIKLVPFCVSLGGTFMVAVDCLCRSLFASEIPISVFTAILGIPFFICLLKKSGGWKL